MNWRVDKSLHRANTDDGHYLVTWSRSKHGNWFNAWYLPTAFDETTRNVIAAAYNGAFVKEHCARHAQLLLDEKQ